MEHEPDGTDVVATVDQARRLQRPPLLVLESVNRFLDDLGIDPGTLLWERIGAGQSNVTYRMRRGRDEFVLRRGPRPPLPPSTHDMIREARIQRLLRDRGVPVPDILAVCRDEDVLGVPFYLMSYLEGVVITDWAPAALDTVHQRRATSRAVVDALVALHTVDVTTDELATFGRADGYLHRQVKRFSELWDVNTTRRLPEVTRIADWLLANTPETQQVTVIHGDYRTGNLMFAPDAPSRVLAILDWEMATLGDPLADLGYLTATWATAGTAPTPLELTSVTRQADYFTRAELVDRYRSALPHLNVDALSWYQTLALWKGAIFSEAIYTRWLSGERPHDTTFAPSLADGVPLLLDRAQAVSGIGT